MDAKRSLFRMIFASVCETNKQNFWLRFALFASFRFATFGVILKNFASFSHVYIGA
jgi:hypothetical protein